MCLYGQLIANPKFKPNQKNGGLVPPVRDKRIIAVPIGCGNCIECRKQKARDWQVRLLEDIKEHKNGIFVTLTFSNESIAQLNKIIDKPPYKPLEGYERDNAIATIAVRRFLERWRKQYKKSVRHWLVTELGHNGTENIHLHGIIWTSERLDKIRHHWKYGYIWPRNKETRTWVNGATINYITKYVHKMDFKHKEYRQIVLTSAGIGANYINTLNAQKNKFNEAETIETYRTENGTKLALPKYYRNKIYSDEEREALWLHKLDKNERWICGEKVDITYSEEEYYNLLEFHRKRNKQLGYGSTYKNWSRKEYEKQRRELIIQERIDKAYNNNKNKKYNAFGAK